MIIFGRKVLGVIKSCQIVFYSVGDKLWLDFFIKFEGEKKLYISSVICLDHNICFNINIYIYIYIYLFIFSNFFPFFCLDRSISVKFVEPKTPSPKHTKKLREAEPSPRQKMLSMTDHGNSFSSGIERLWWRNRKPFRRAAKKRAELDILSPFFHVQQ